MKQQSHIFRIVMTVCVAACMALMSSQEAKAQQVAVKTNALFWAGLTPNIGLEVVAGEHASVDFSAFGHWKPYGLDSKLLAFQPEFRYWFNGRPMTREYLGISAMVATYDMTMRSYVYNGNAASLGITGGYVFSLGLKWRFEVCGGFGVMFFKQKQYYQHDNYDDYFVDEAVKANSWGYKLFPAKLGVTFSYIIK